MSRKEKRKRHTFSDHRTAWQSAVAMIALAATLSQKLSIAGSGICLTIAFLALAIMFFGKFRRMKATILTGVLALTLGGLYVWLSDVRQPVELKIPSASDIAGEVVRELPSSVSATRPAPSSPAPPPVPSAKDIADALAKQISKPGFVGGPVLTVMSGAIAFEEIPELHRKGIKVEMYLDNDTFPQTELQNVSGQVWAESKYLLATKRQTSSPLEHPWVIDRQRRFYRIEEAVFPKMSGEWLPTLMFDLPPVG